MKIEQEIFYPAALAADETLILESFEEHAIAELVLKRLLATDPEDRTFNAKAIVLKELPHVSRAATRSFAPRRTRSRRGCWLLRSPPLWNCPIRRPVPFRWGTLATGFSAEA